MLYINFPSEKIRLLWEPGIIWILLLTMYVFYHQVLLRTLAHSSHLSSSNQDWFHSYFAFGFLFLLVSPVKYKSLMSNCA